MVLKKQNFDLIASAKSQLSNANTGWSQKARESALSRLSNIGLPSHRDEYWKYTNPAELLTGNLHVSSVECLEHANVFSEIEVLKIVFCDGIFSPDLSDDFSSENISSTNIDIPINLTGSTIIYTIQLNTLNETDNFDLMCSDSSSIDLFIFS